MNPEIIYDIIGIGIGPFNLGLAALCADLPELNCIFFDQTPEFDWHPGMMLDTARLQVPFYADLVTVVNPTSRFTFLNYLKEKKRLFKFAIHENNFVSRKQYNDYCRWVASTLQSLNFNSCITEVGYCDQTGLYLVSVLNLKNGEIKVFPAKHIVLGIGTEPLVPNCATSLAHPLVIHSSEYLHHKTELLKQPSITIIGSGQSAAEVFLDLLQAAGDFELNWFTRSERFYPMEYSKLTLEMTSPDYIDFFHSLKQNKKAGLLKLHDSVYKGINFSLINEIYDLLYLKDFDQHPGVTLQASTELLKITPAGDSIELALHHTQLEQQFIHKTSAVILATGYKQRFPAFLQPIRYRINWPEQGSFEVARNYSIDITGRQVFVQNAELHSHGFTAPDLGMGPYRNATILNTILGHEYFEMEKKIAFQNFGFNKSKSL
jgi:lysine N6-hydroxylase